VNCCTSLFQLNYGHAAAIASNVYRVRPTAAATNTHPSITPPPDWHLYGREIHIAFNLQLDHDGLFVRLHHRGSLRAEQCTLRGEEKKRS
jgi:hypothetical protein